MPEFFQTQTGIDKFANFLRTFVDLEIPHIQFNVVRREDLLKAQKIQNNIVHSLLEWQVTQRILQSLQGVTK